MNVGTKVVLDFLSDYEGFGSRGHLETARALRDVLERSQDEDVRKLLAVKVYAEFISSLEDLGALCIAVRHRDDGVGLMYAYLSYEQRKACAPPTRLVELFEIASRGSALTEALTLPPLTEILRAAPGLKQTLLARLYSEANRLIEMGAKAYLYENRAFVRAYNKTKHGFVVVKDQHVFQPDAPKTLPSTAWIVSENPSYHPDRKPELPVVELYAVELKDVDSMVERIEVIRGAVVTICRLVRDLLGRGLVTCADNQA